MQMKSSLKLGKVNVGRPTIKKNRKEKKKKRHSKILHRSKNLKRITENSVKLGKAIVSSIKKKLCAVVDISQRKKMRLKATKTR